MNITLEFRGFRFLPRDDEIINYFLLNKMKGYHDRSYHIREVDILDHEPWDLPALSVVKSMYQEWLFFYKLNKISEGRNHRETKAGFWKSTGQDRAISFGGRVIGTKKTLVFYTGRTPRGVKTDWVLHQYRATPDFVPPNAESSYVVGYLRNKAAENTESSISNSGQPSSPFAASTTHNNPVGVAYMEVAPQMQSDSMDYEFALQAQLADQGAFDDDIIPLLPSAVASNDQNRMEEGISLEDLLTDDDEQNEWRCQFDTIEEESDFLTSLFPVHDYHPDYRPPGYSEGFNQKRMENAVHHDEILIMDSGVESATVTAYGINCLESVREERSVNSRACKSQYEPRPHKSVVQRHPSTVQFQAGSSGIAVSRDKSRESGVRGPVVELVHRKQSMVQSNKVRKMDRDRTTKPDSSSGSNGSASSGGKDSLKFLEMSQRSCKPVPPLVYVRNIVLGGILFIFFVWEVMFLH
ncbi:hypothetical protein PTKIN_Ptkin12aG0158800 [Pterospermum kingtungense]